MRVRSPTKLGEIFGGGHEGMGWGIGKVSSLEDRDYIEYPPKASSQLAKAVRKQGTKRVPGSRSLQQSVAGRPGSSTWISWTQEGRAYPHPQVGP